MRNNFILSLLFAEAIAGSAINITPRDQPASDCKATGKAVYILTNESPNSVLALPINEDGTLSKGVLNPTGGKGGSSVDSDGKPAGPDALASQSALTVAGNHVFAVNPGSNTVSMLSISHDATKLRMVGPPAAVPGQFPNTVAASAKHGLACVGMTGAAAGISCAPFSARGGLGRFDARRPIDLGQTTPPAGPANTLSQVFFSADEATLYTMVKGDPAAGANATGFVSALPIIDSTTTTTCRGKVTSSTAARRDARSSPAGTAVLFGSANLPGGDVFATDASFGAAVLAVVDAGPGGGGGAVTTTTTRARTPIPGQAATCWAAFAPATGSVFVTDVAVPRVVEMGAADARILGLTDLSAANPDAGYVDLRAAGAYLYVLAPGNRTAGAAVVVLDISGGQGSAKQIQRLELGDMAGKSAQGMAILE
ncbi:hypothetical protein F4780DRAFT_787072 [Xylariomycetidae sp. FL0641]|nr:hypothetical protein F4780DRAFT_787072 [Xylariomycetidae sp. FL0641]